MKKILHRFLLYIVLVVSLVVNLGLGFYHFGNWQHLSEWQVEALGYRLSSGQNPFESEIALSRVNNLTGQYEQLASVSKEINQQFYQLLDEFKQIEGTADLTRETIADVVGQLEAIKNAQSDAKIELAAYKKALEIKDAAIAEKMTALNEAEKLIKNQQRQLRASPVIRMDNDAYTLQSQFNRLDQVVAQQDHQAEFIQTTLRKGIVSLPVEFLFESGEPDQFTDSAERFLKSFVKSMGYLPQASIEIIQVNSAAEAGALRWQSNYSSALASFLLANDFDATRLLVASQPFNAEQTEMPARIEIHVSI